ncbi:uncharacterized protein LOC122394090 [Amphibalanus amphitrite]|uniref:uncharacterized protein LOC122394090 n=1 Tax=Amphibalanus amphitrite TaxID=1232801 RepID=UPI001C9171D6|nr:uncharacterized protein LOC122394090 [Amphibalanus amphitrite]
MSSRSGRIGCRLVIPQRLRRTVLEALHASHLGKEKTKARARQIVYWPGIYRDVENVTRCCTSCQRDLLAQQQETMMRRPPAERPFELHIDFADHAGRKYLVAVDRYSGWLFVADLGVSAPAYTGPKDDSRRHDERTRYATYVNGRHGKRAFGGTRLFDVVFRAVRRNGLTQDTNNGQLEVAPRKWFTGARNRDGGRQERTPAGV